MTRDWIPGTAAPEITHLAATDQLIVALDFDGTASPLVPGPMTARALPEVRVQVERLASLSGTVVAYVSGRSLHDLRLIAEHDDSSPIVLVGSHGAEYWYPGVGIVDTLVEHVATGTREELWAAVRPILDKYENVELEEKAFGMGIHTRQATADAESAAFAEIDALVAGRFPNWRRRQGHHVLEFASRPEGKDAAIVELRSKFQATGMLFAGDDVTDEDAIRALLPGDLGVRVGLGETAAALRVESPQQIAALLDTLATERAAIHE